MNLWKRFAFLAHSLAQRLTPPLALSEIVEKWDWIDRLLADAPRKRKYQLEDAWFEYLA